ncbi:hypothetical protein Gotri_007897 [Gossypium trilobum]|uniref:Uncharacterized protein n=1 Tax=Gossypium trilobum TaxID=34281 RepID=A0A7J9EIE0_9ROSI|nr:hypothetical protein [Gossypium trilobum]
MMGSENQRKHPYVKPRKHSFNRITLAGDPLGLDVDI